MEPLKNERARSPSIIGAGSGLGKPGAARGVPPRAVTDSFRPGGRKLDIFFLPLLPPHLLSLRHGHLSSASWLERQM